MVTQKEKEDAKRKYKRRARNIIVHRPMQREFTLILVALLMVSSLAIGFVIHDTIREAAFGGGFRFGKINPYEVLSEVRYQLIIRVTCILFVTLIVIGVFAVFFLHRVAGPVYRFRQVLLRMNDGETPPPTQLREGDFFGETALELNEHVKKWRFEKEKEGRIKSEMSKILNAQPSGDIASAAQAAINIMEDIGG